MEDKTNKDYEFLMRMIGFIVFAFSLMIIIGFIPSNVPSTLKLITTILFILISEFNLILLIGIGIILSLIGAEFFYIKISKKLVIRKGGNKKSCLVLLKLGSFIVGPFIATFFLTITYGTLIYLEVITINIFYNWLQFLIATGITAIVLLIIWVNVEFVGSKYARNETDKEYKDRMKKQESLKRLKEKKKKVNRKKAEKKERDRLKPLKYHVGEKVRVKMDNICGNKLDKYAGKIVTISCCFKNDKTYSVEERFWNFYDECELEKIKLKRKKK